MTLPLAFIDSLGSSEMVLVAIVAILLFGERLPEVARKFGKSWTEFKKGLRGIQDEFTKAVTSTTDYNPLSSSTFGSYHNSSYESAIEEHEEATAPKFVPPPSESASAAAADPQTAAAEGNGHDSAASPVGQQPPAASPPGPNGHGNGETGPSPALQASEGAEPSEARATS